MARELIFRIEDNGAFTISAPQDIALALGLCEMAKNAIIMQAAQAQQRVQVAPAGAVPFLKKV